MGQISINNGMTGAGVVSQDIRNITVDNILNISESIAAGQSGTINGSYVVTLASGHGILDTDTVGVYWDGGYRYGVDVTAVDTTTITLDNTTGDGTALPVTGTVYISIVTELDLAFSGNAMAAFSLGGNIGLFFTIEDGASVHAARETAASASYQWDSGNAETNPVAGDSVTKINVYNQSTTAGTITGLIGYDNA